MSTPLPPDGPAAPDVRWSVERRLGFIEEQLFWQGEVNRADLIERFGVSLSQASADVQRYLALGPSDVAYDKSRKRYVAGADFVPMLGAPDARAALAERRIGLLDGIDAGPLADIPVDATPVPDRALDPFLVRRLAVAIRRGMAVAILYQSMSRAEPADRVIEPHAFGHDGFRWHVRAFDRPTATFRDFVLGRILRHQPADGAMTRAAADIAWQTRAELEIAPHPGLTPAQAAAVKLDYGFSGETLRLPVRLALLYYALKRLGLDTPPDARAPHDQQIVLVNDAEVAAMVEAVRTGPG